MGNREVAMGRTGLEVAVIGMAGRFPQAKDIDEYWANLIAGKECTTHFSDEDLRRSGISARLINDPQYVKVKGCLEDIQYFDAEFFGYAPQEIQVMDPQMRVLHECAYEALEDAGYNIENYEGMVGLFAGALQNRYWEVLSAPNATSLSELFEALHLIDKDFLSSRISYKLNLQGPSITISTACTTSLVAIHCAYKSLLADECDIALAGGVSLVLPNKSGYLYQHGIPFSPDGRCRSFDASANGAVGGEAAGIVVLKSLERAVSDGDHIYAVIKGSATNNDGARKVGYTAPGVAGPAEVIKAAQRFAQVSPESISYVEAHGMGTALSDMIEIEALKIAFDLDKVDCCRIGSHKPNIGYSGPAAGVAGFIKTALALHHRALPPSINCINPREELSETPFFVNTELCEWENPDHPLRAGVNGFAVGGTNAHIVLEEAPLAQRSADDGHSRLVVWSGRTDSALSKVTAALAKAVGNDNRANLADIAYTLQVGRRHFPHRRFAVCDSIDDLVGCLTTLDTKKVRTEKAPSLNASPVLMFSRANNFSIAVYKELYDSEESFREIVDEALASTSHELAKKAAKIFRKAKMDEATIDLVSDVTRSLGFFGDYALAKALMSWGVKPLAMIGYGEGECVAAALSGVLSISDALAFIQMRTELEAETPPRQAISVNLSEENIRGLLEEDMAIDAVNSSSNCVVSGDPTSLTRFKQKLENGKVSWNDYPHPIILPKKLINSEREEKIDKQLNSIILSESKIPYISSACNGWMRNGSVRATEYFKLNLCEQVRFADMLDILLREKEIVMVDFDAKRLLSRYFQQNHNKRSEHSVVGVMKNRRDSSTAVHDLLNKAGTLWALGVAFDWKAFNRREQKWRISLPKSPFERRYFGWDNLLLEDDVEVDISQ